MIALLTAAALWSAATGTLSPTSDAPAVPVFHADTVLLERARRLLREVPLVDGHNDLATTGPLRDSQGDWSRVTLLSGDARLMTDIPRLQSGQVGAQFWAAFVEQDAAGPTDYYRRGMQSVETIHALIGRYPGTFEFAATAADIERIHREGRIAALIGLEGGHMIENSLQKLREFEQAGVRYMTLAHQTNDWADSSAGAPVHHGLTEFGREVIAEMNRLGMLVDLSHASDETARQALLASRAPVIFSHSSAAALNPHPRNVPDSNLRLLARNDGVIMVNFSSDFVAPEGYRYARERDQAFQGLTREQRRLWREAHPAPRGTVEDVANHIDHLVKVAGMGHVGLGSDFDGTPTMPVGLSDVGMYPNLVAELLRRGYRERDIKKIAGLNILRVLRAADRVARKLQKRARRSNLAAAPRPVAAASGRGHFMFEARAA